MTELTPIQLEAIEFASSTLVNHYDGHSYPIVKEDEHGNTLPYESGCVEWVVCTKCEVISAFLESETEEYYKCHVSMLLNWTDEDEDSYPVFEVLVYKDSEEANGLSCDYDKDCELTSNQ